MRIEQIKLKTVAGRVLLFKRLFDYRKNRFLKRLECFVDMVYGRGFGRGKAGGRRVGGLGCCISSPDSYSVFTDPFT